MSKTTKRAPATAEHTWLDTFTMAVAALVLVAFTALSAYLNRVYAVAHSEDVAYHVALPILALLAGIFAEVIFMSNVNKPTRWLTGVLVTVGFLAVMVASYLAVLGVASMKYPTFPVLLIYVLAAFPDGFMVIGATVLLALRVRRTRLRGVVTETRPKARGAGSWSLIRDAATSRAVSVLAPSTEAANHQVNTLTEPRGGVETVPVEDDDTWNLTFAEDENPSPEPSAEPIAEGATPSVSPLVEPSPEPRRPARGASARPSTEEIDPSVEPFMEAARSMVAEGLIARKSPVEVARIIAAVDGGATDNAVKSSGLGSASTAAKVRAAWAARELADHPDPHPAVELPGPPARERVLAEVG